MSKEITQITSSGDRVSLFRKDKKLSQQELADAIGVSRGYIGDIERNRSEPSSNFLTLLASKLNVSVDWLLTGEGEMYRLQTGLNDLHATKIVQMYDALNDVQQREILSALEEKKQLNNLMEAVHQLQLKVG
ncbi:MAG: helix-turn-helix transcriptional regulator [Methylococcales bacterium]